MNLFDLVRRQHGSVATNYLGGLLGKSPEQLQPSIDSAYDTVLDGFSYVAKKQSGREALYDAIVRTDDNLVDNPGAIFQDRDARTVFTEANDRLNGIVGSNTRKHMVDSLRSASDLSESDAENMLGYVTPGVLGVMKRSTCLNLR